MPDSFSATCTTCAGSFRLPRNGTGARNGLSVSISSRSRGMARATLPQIVGLGKRDDARQRNIEPQLERRTGEGGVAGEAMEDAANLSSPFETQDRQRVLVGLARVHDDGQAQFAGEPDLRAEHGPLHFGCREVVVVVEADFADGARRRRGGELFSHHDGGALRIIGEPMRVVGVDADGHAHVRPQRLHASRLRGSRVAGFEDDERALEAGRLRASDDRVEVGGECLVRQVAVAVDHITEPACPAPAGSGT